MPVSSDDPRRDLRRMAREIFEARHGRYRPGGLYESERVIGEIPSGAAQVLTASRFKRQDSRGAEKMALRIWSLGPEGERFPIRRAGLEVSGDILPNFIMLMAMVYDDEIARRPPWAEPTRENR